MKTQQNNQGGIFQRNWHALLLATIIPTMLTFSSQAQTSPSGDFTDGFDNNTSSTQDSTAGWAYFYNGAGTVGLDTTVKDTGAGSLKVTIPFTSTFRQVDQGTWFGNFDNNSAFDSDVVYDGTQFTNISFDIMMDPSDPISPTGDYGYIGVGLEDKGTPAGARETGIVLVPGVASNTWVHFTVPIDKSATYLSSPGVIGVAFTYSTYDNNSYNSFLTNPVVLHIDNLVVKLGAVSNPPPVVSIKQVTPGLNFVEGSISSQFDRQNIITANGANSTANYSWAGASSGSPVTYSFTINQWNAPDLNYHIYFYQTSGAGGASAPDYNQPNVLIFQLTAPTPSTVATLTWKTNSPMSGTTGTAFSVTNATVLGTWQVKFTSATGGTILAPGGNSYPFTIDPSLAANIANPITVNFGINPAVDTANIVGESVVVSQISITGVDPVSIDTATTDNFLADSSLDTNSWTVNALFPASILFVPSNTTYSVGWTLPAIGLSPEVNSALGTSSPWIVPAAPTVTLFPGKTSLIPNSALPAGNTAFFRLSKLTPTQLQVLLPGEVNAPNTVNGKTGTPTAITNNVGNTTITVNEVDANFNIVSSSDNVALTTSAEDDSINTPNISLSNGTGTGTIVFGDTGPDTVTATDTSNTNILNGTNTVTIN
jgi:hypothetical protein